MKVDAVGFKNNNYLFGGKEKKQENAPVSNPASSSGLAKVPVLVLLAMNPATLNSAIPLTPETNNNHVIMSAPEAKSPEKATYVIAPEVPQSQKPEPPFGWAYFAHVVSDIKLAVPAQGNYSNYTMVFSAPRSCNDAIERIHLIKEGSVGSVNASEHPPEVKKLIYHNLGKNSFCSVITREHLIGPERKALGTMTSEIVLDDESAQKIIDLISGDTKWKNNTHIQVIEKFDAKISKPTTFLYEELGL